MGSTIWQVALDAPLRRLFDYLPAAAAAVAPPPGVRVRVPFGRRRLIGLLVGVSDHSILPAGKLRAAQELIDREPVLDAALLQVLRRCADYYHQPLGQVCAAALPKLVRLGAPARKVVERWHATSAGEAALARGELRRAPKQRQLLARLAQNERGGSAEELLAHDAGWRTAARALAARGWIASSETQAWEAPPAARAPGEAALALTADQQAAVDAVDRAAGRFAAFVLRGVTGSGKSEVYLHLAARALARSEAVLVLVPEISLTPQLIARFEARFATPVTALHSGLTDAQRLANWREVCSGRARIVLGTRSAVFAPVTDLGLIVVDEEHDPSFKQQEGGFRYSARDVAVVRAQQHGIPIVLGSATPALETLQNVASGRYQCFTLPRRPEQAPAPQLRLVDLRQESVRVGLSATAVQAIERHLGQASQALVFINRRGYAPTLACTACGWIAPCDDCDARMTMHRGADRLRCHHCGAERALPRQCPQCGYALRPVGQGTERIEEALAELFPQATLARLDRDVVRTSAQLAQVVEQVTSGAARILIGTQMVTKGHDFPDVTLVVVLNADQGLFNTDFRAAERLAQTVVQVAGRAGRRDRRGEVLIQTEFPEHPLLQSLLHSGYEGFAAAALEERRAAGWPPFSRLAALRASGTRPAAAADFLQQARRLAGKPRGVRLLGPAPAARAKRAGRYHAQLLVESANRSVLQRFLAQWVAACEELPGVHTIRWALDVDPLELF